MDMPTDDVAGILERLDQLLRTMEVRGWHDEMDVARDARTLIQQQAEERDRLTAQLVKLADNHAKERQAAFAQLAEKDRELAEAKEQLQIARTIPGRINVVLADEIGARQQAESALTALRAEHERLQAVAAKALHEMCRTVSYRDSFTDVVDELDALLTPAQEKP